MGVGFVLEVHPAFGVGKGCAKWVLLAVTAASVQSQTDMPEYFSI